jgi:spermidine synthase
VSRAAIVLCLLVSGWASLVYQIVWTRLLGFAFGTTLEAIGAVLAVFFAGLAGGNALAARGLARTRRPLRVYALLELGIAAFALASLPVLRALDGLYAWTGTDHGPAAQAAIRVVAAALVLLPPTLAMGATLPVVARGVVTREASLGRACAWLYAGNTAGAVLGAYLCGFWMIPFLGLGRSVLAAALGNGVAGLVAFALSRRAGDAAMDPAPAAPHPGAAHGAIPDATRRTFLALFAVSGFVAIGYEMVWSRVFGIVMEGTLYGFAAVLASFLLGLALGSLAIARSVDRLRDLPRAFGLLHLAIAASVWAGLQLVPHLPHLHRVLRASLGGGDGLHLLFLLVVPIVLVPTALFGAAFPVLIRIHARGAGEVGAGIGVATAVNTAGSIAASLLVGFWALPALGMDATLYALCLVDLGVALLVLLGFQAQSGRARLATGGLAAVLVATFAVSYNGVRVEDAIAGRDVRASGFAEYARDLEQRSRSLALLVEGRSSIVTVYRTRDARSLFTNGLPESTVQHRPPYYPVETALLGVLPYVFADTPERSLVIGLGGGNTVLALARTRLREIDVVELEPAVADAVRVLHAGRANPLDDPRVRLRINDGRNELLLERHRGGAGFDVIASQPSHPWIQGAANLFTEEFFELAKANLSEGGVFACWVNGFRTDAESLLALVASFERIFPGSFVVDGSGDGSRSSLLLLGSTAPLRLDLARARERLAEPGVRALLGLYGLEELEPLLAQLEGPASAFAALAPGARNTDDDAFVETRIPRRFEWGDGKWGDVDWGAIEARLAADAPVLPPVAGVLDAGAIADSLARGSRKVRARRAAKLERWLRVHGGSLEAVQRGTWLAKARLASPASESDATAELRRLAELHPASPAPLRALGEHLAAHGLAREAEGAWALAWARSGDAADAFGAASALHATDPAAARRWLARIPESERDRFPRLAVFDAEAALARGVAPSAARVHLEAVLRHRDTEEGRRSPGLAALGAELARAAGDAALARALADEDHRERQTRAKPRLREAERALARGDLRAARAALDAAEVLVPTEPRVAELRARAALARGDRAGAEAALASLRGRDPTLAGAVAAENRLRDALGLPLLPDLGAAALVAPGAARGPAGDAREHGRGSVDPPGPAG